MTTPTPVTMASLTLLKDSPQIATPDDVTSMATEIIALRESMKRMTETFVPITGENDPRAEWALRAMRGIMIENRFLAAIVYPIPDGHGGQMLRYGGAATVVAMMTGGRDMIETPEQQELNELRARATILQKSHELMMRMIERQINPPLVRDQDGTICSIPSVEAMQRAEFAAREANARAEAAEKALEHSEDGTRSLQSEIEAGRAGAESYKRRIAELEAEKAAAGWDPSRPRYVSGLLPCQPGSVQFVPFAKEGVDTRPTMQELRGIIQEYAPKDYVYCVLKMLSRCGMIKP